MMAKTIETTESLQFQKSKLDIRVAIITLLTVVLGLGSTIGLLVSQKNEIEKLQGMFCDLHSLRAALAMTLEGIWSYRIDYEKYFDEPMKPGQAGSKYLKGEAHVMWQQPTNDTYKYTVYIGAALYETNKEQISIVTAFSKNTIITDASGIPQDGFSMSGEYIARTSSDIKYANPAQKTFTYEQGKITRDPE